MFADSSLGYIDIYGNFEWRPKWGTIPQPIPYKGIALANCAIWPYHVIYLMAGSDGNAPSPSDSKSEMLTFTPQPNTSFIVG